MMKRTRFEGIELAVMKDSARILPGVCEGMAVKAWPRRLARRVGLQGRLLPTSKGGGGYFKIAFGTTVLELLCHSR